MTESKGAPGEQRHDFPEDLLTAEERAALAAFARTLGGERAALAAEWARAVLAHLPEVYPVDGPISPVEVEEITRTLIAAALERLSADDLQGLSDACYQVSYSVVQVDGARQLSLRRLYDSARFGLKVAQSRLDDPTGVLAVALGKLLGHLLMVLGFAYSDAREAALDHTRVALERMVEERKAALGKERALADTIIETLPGIFFMIDQDERLIRWNHELENESQYAAEELRGRHPLDFFDAESRPHLAEHLRKCFAEGFSSAEGVLIARDGSQHPRLFTSRRIDFAQGSCLVAIGIDISARRRAELSIQREKELADNIIESLPGIFYLFDDQGRFLRWNRAFATVSQYSAEEIGRMTPIDFFEDEDKNVIADRIGKVFTEGFATAEADFVSRDGTRRPHFFTGRRALVDDRVCVVGMALDVTERRRAEQELQRARTAQLFGALLESAPDAMVASNDRGEIVFVNSQSESLFGYRRDEMLGRGVGRLFSDSVRESPRPPYAPLHTATVETDGLRCDGVRVPVEVKLSPLETGEGPLVISAIRDVTDRRRAEEEIRRLNVDLERRVVERTRELAQSNADLEQFAYVTSHDLQEPLRAVASYTQLLERRYADRLDGDALRFIERSTAAVGRMQALIRDLLQYARVGTRAHPFALTDCDSVLDDVLEDLQAGIAEAGAQVIRQQLPSLPGDRSQLRQLLQNLIGNAIKFRGVNPPEVHITARRAAGDWLFEVRDNGIGIEPEYRDRVFIIFQRLHSRRAYAGTGVGLAVCKRIVEHHGGRIWIEANAPAGTTVCFRLPAAAPLALGPPRAPSGGEVGE